MSEHQLLVFDLDGTLSDPTIGVARCINHALVACDARAIDERTMSQYIGPPLDVVFRRIVPTASENTIVEMVARYRERYGEVGYAENVMYQGIPDALEYLAIQGLSMGVCTSKRADFAERILALFHLRQYFEFVSGGDVGVRKEDQLRVLLQQGTITARSAMIGDRAADIVAAKATGLRSVGVLWGHGSLQELQQAAPDLLLETPDALKGLIDGV